MSFARTKITPRVCEILLAALLSFVGLGHTAPTRADDAIVTHPSNAKAVMTLASIRAIFSMRLNTWPDGTAVTVFVLPDRNPLHAEFSRTVLKMLPYRLRSEWDRLVFSGTGVAPIEVSSVEEMRRRVAGTPGSIGYLDEGDLDESVRAIKVQ